MRTTYCKKCDKTVRFYTDYGTSDTWLYICTECESGLNNQFKLCIMAAGKVFCNNDVNGLHKGLLPLENKSVLSNIIRNFDREVEVVIAVGYKSDQIKSYMSVIHPNRNKIVKKLQFLSISEDVLVLFL